MYKNINTIYEAISRLAEDAVTLAISIKRVNQSRSMHIQNVLSVEL